MMIKNCHFTIGKVTVFCVLYAFFIQIMKGIKNADDGVLLRAISVLRAWQEL